MPRLSETVAPDSGSPPAGRRERHARDERLRTLLPVLGTAALLVLLTVSRAAVAGEPGAMDVAVREWTLRHQWPPAVVIFRLITRLGSVGPMELLALGAALLLLHRQRLHAAAFVLVAPAFAVTSFEIVKLLIHRARPPGLSPHLAADFAFPSGHSTASAAVCATLALLFFRERLWGAAIALAVGVVPPLLVGASRVYLDVHWATDVLGGWSGGLFIATLSVMMHERSRSTAE